MSTIRVVSSCAPSSIPSLPPAPASPVPRGRSQGAMPRSPAPGTPRVTPGSSGADEQGPEFRVRNCDLRHRSRVYKMACVTDARPGIRAPRSRGDTEEDRMALRQPDGPPLRLYLSEPGRAAADFGKYLAA